MRCARVLRVARSLEQAMRHANVREGDRVSVGVLARAARSLVLGYFGDLVQHGAHLDMSADELSECLSDSELVVSSELVVFTAAKDFIEARRSAGYVDAATEHELLKHVRTEHLQGHEQLCLRHEPLFQRHESVFLTELWARLRKEPERERRVEAVTLDAIDARFNGAWSPTSHEVGVHWDKDFVGDECKAHDLLFPDDMANACGRTFYFDRSWRNCRRDDDKKVFRLDTSTRKDGCTRDYVFPLSTLRFMTRRPC